MSDDGDRDLRYDKDRFPSSNGHRYGWGTMMLVLTLLFGGYFLLVILTNAGY